MSVHPSLFKGNPYLKKNVKCRLEKKEIYNQLAPQLINWSYNELFGQGNFSKSIQLAELSACCFELVCLWVVQVWDPLTIHKTWRGCFTDILKMENNWNTFRFHTESETSLDRKITDLTGWKGMTLEHRQVSRGLKIENYHKWIMATRDIGTASYRPFLLPKPCTDNIDLIQNVLNVQIEDIGKRSTQKTI